jgi:hypothetical protein
LLTSASRRALIRFSAIFIPRRHLLISPLLVCALFSPAVRAADSAACELTSEVRAQLERASAAVTGPSDSDHNIGPFLALRQHHANDLLVHERYQDAVQRYGIEGHLRKLTEEYQVLLIQHPDSLMYEYLYAHSLIGRNTPSAIQQMTAISAEHPGFAPAHRSLAEIYGSDTFHDNDKATAERESFLALCPGSTLQVRPGALRQPSPLLDQAEHLLSGNGDPDRIATMALQAIREDERRLQRIRPFDWYSVDFKRQSQRELQAEYWRLWSLQVRCYRRAGQPRKATALLSLMDERATSLRRDSGSGYWEALAALVRLYAEGDQRDSANPRLGDMQEFLAQHPDPSRSKQLQELRQLLATER